MSEAVAAPATSSPASSPAAATPSAPSAPAAAPSGPAGGTDAASPAKPLSADSKYADKVAAPDAAADAAAKKARLIKYKVDGQMRELNLDAIADAELATKLQFSEAARARMQEAAEIKKAVQNLVTALKEDPFEALKDPAFGVDLEQLAVERLKAKWQESQLPEHEQERLRLQRELEARDAKLKAIEAEREAAAQRTLEAQVYQETEREFLEALEQSQLPKSRHALALMAEVAALNLERGLELTPQQMAAEVGRRLLESHAPVMRALSDEKLIEHLGPEVVKRVLRHSIQKVKPQSPFQPPKPPPAVAADDERPERKPSDPLLFRKMARGLV